MSDFLDDDLADEDAAYDRVREDGWGHGDITARTYLDDEGRYRGPKDEVG